jgi:hypothetical protein
MQCDLVVLYFLFFFFKMGVTDLFEPNRADFSIMTEEKFIYIKHLEQSIDLTIRTHSVKTVIGK